MIVNLLKVILISAEALTEAVLAGCAAAQLISGDSGYERALLVGVLFMFLGSLIVSIAEYVRIVRGKRWVLLPMHWMKATMIVLGLARYAFAEFAATWDGTTLSAAFVLLLAAIVMIAVGYGIQHAANKRDSQHAGDHSTNAPYRIKFYAEWNYPVVVPEYRRLHPLADKVTPEEPPHRGKQSSEDPAPEHPLPPEQLAEVNVYACVPFAYLFAWLVRRNGLCMKLLWERCRLDALAYRLEPIRQGTGDPAEFLARYLDRRLLQEDIAPGRRLDFLRWYCFTPDPAKFPSRYEKDYFALVQGKQTADSNVRWCRSFSWESYLSMEKAMDGRYNVFLAETAFDHLERWLENRYSHAFDMDFEVYIEAVGAEDRDDFYRYVRGCLAEVDTMPEERLAEICAAFTEQWGEDWTGSLTPESFRRQLDYGSVTILKPYGEELAYVLGFEAEFEPEHGVSVVIKGGKVTFVGYRSDAPSPWVETLRSSLFLK